MGAVDFFHKQFVTKAQSYGDLLRHDKVISDGVILGKGGELMASFRYRGQDTQCASIEELQQIALRVNSAVKKLGSGWMWHSTSSRIESADYPEGGAFPDEVTRAIENERRAQYRAEGMHFENDYVLTITYLPPLLLQNKIRDFVFDKPNSEKSNVAIAKKELDYFIKVASEVASELSTDLGGMEPLLAEWDYDPRTRRNERFDEQVSFFLWCATGLRQRVRLPAREPAVGLDVIIGSQPFSAGARPMVGKKYVRTISIETPPEEGTEVGMLDMLNQLPVAYRWTTRWIARDPQSAKAEVDKTASKWRQKIRGLVDQITGRENGKVDADALKMANDAETAITDINSGDVSYGHYTSTIVLMDESETRLEAAVVYICKVLRYASFIVRDEYINTVEAFLGSIPGHGYENVRRPLLHSLNLAHLLPLSSVWQGQEGNPCSFYKKYYGKDELPPPLFYGAASGGTPFRVVLHNGDLGHTLVVGPPGAGKSTVLGLMAVQQFRYPDTKVFCFEIGESMFVACEAAHGSHFNFMSDDETKKIGMCPFARVDKTGERAWAATYLETILTINGVIVTKEMRKEIGRSLDLLATRPTNMRSFTDLKMLVQDNDIRSILELYENQYAGGMLNHREDSISLSRFTVFEMEQLMEAGPLHVAPVLLYLFRAIERQLDGSPVMIILDEAWKMFEHALFAEVIRKWLKVLRKANALVVFATQELDDLNRSKIKSTLYSACQTRILLPNPTAVSDDGLKTYGDLGLTRREIELIAYATPKRDYFFTSPAGRRLFQLELGPVALAFVATSGKSDRTLARKLQSMYKENWVGEWLREKGVNPAVLGGKWAANDAGGSGRAAA